MRAGSEVRPRLEVGGRMFGVHARAESTVSGEPRRRRQHKIDSPDGRTDPVASTKMDSQSSDLAHRIRMTGTCQHPVPHVAAEGQYLQKSGRDDVSFALPRRNFTVHCALAE